MKKRFLPILLVLSMLMPMLISVQVSADEGTKTDYGTYDGNNYHITTAQQLVNISEASKGSFPSVLGYDFVLDNDIDVSGYDAQINIGNLPLTGESTPFYGTFDGHGHTISGLEFTNENSSDAGLFAYTDGAIIKNLVIENAYIKSARRGGIVVGKAVNTQLYNITVRDSELEMFTNGAVIELITGLGISGGAIVGTMEHSDTQHENSDSDCSVMYNCESRDTSVTVNTAAGVQALSGDGIYIGGLTGYSQDSTIEYSRAIRGKVEMRFDIVIGALGGKKLYAGGITGGMEGSSNVIDCFATTPVSISSINAVAVGSGTICYAAGITGAAYGNSIIERCHYSGVLYSYLYNAILVIPIPLTNKHIYGLVGLNDSTAQIKNSYFDYDRAMTDKDYSSITIPAVCDREDNADAAAKPSEQYISQLVWSNRGYDFNGTADRTTAADSIYGVGANHHNKWVMDYETKMPVHGLGVTVGTDFPNAGTVTLGKTALRDPVSFTEGSRTQILSVNDMTLNLSQTSNSGYNFKGWYNGNVDSTGNVSVSGESPIETGNTYIITEPKDNTTYAAHYTANVVFKSPDGTQQDITVEYTYNQPLKLDNKLFSYNGQTLIGWNTTGTITDATSDQINATDFVQTGTPVTNPMTLYPVFAGVGDNIIAVFEQTGNQIATDTDLKTETGSDNKGWYVKYAYKGEESTEPDGYLFDGWYQIPYDESLLGSNISLDDAVCVSRDKKYYVNEDYQTTKYLYVAKFKYRVTAWMPVKYRYGGLDSRFYYRNYDNDIDQGRYTELWANYGDTTGGSIPTLIIPIPPTGEDGEFKYWTDDSSVIGNTYTASSLSGLSNPEFISNITAPLDLYGLIDPGEYYDTVISAFSDFPGSASISISYTSHLIDGDPFIANTSLNNNYNFKDISFYNENSYSKKSTSLSWDLKVDNYDYVQHDILVRAAADVDFHKKDGFVITTSDDFSIYNNPADWDSNRTVTRKYQSLLFGGAAELNDPPSSVNDCFKVITDSPTPIGVGTTPALDGSNYDIKIDNYKFLGWVNKEALRDIDSNYLYDYKETPAQDQESDEELTTATPEPNVTSDSKKAEGYILKSDDRVYAYMDIYPLYAKYKVILADNLGDSENKPKNSYTVSDDGIITITPDREFNADIKEIIGTDSKGETITLTKDEETGYYKNDSENPLDVDETYTFTVGYEFTVTYNKVQGTQDTMTLKRGYGEPVGETYEPNTSAPTDKIFAGWVNVTPEVGKDYVEYEQYSDASIVTSDTLVTSNMSLYPAYTTPNVTTFSNIDTDDVKHTKYSVKDGKVTIIADTVDGYKFAYWLIKESDSQKYYSSSSSCELSSADSVSGAEFIAVYNPLFKYMIPSVDETGQVTDYPENNAVYEMVSYGIEFAGGSAEAMHAVEAALKDSKYTFGGWTATEGGTTEYTNTNVTKPETLYPILKEALIVTYNYKNTDGTDISHREKYPKTGNINLLDLGDYSYTYNGINYSFTGWSKDNDFYTGGSEYNLTESVTFTAQWSSDANGYTVWSNVSNEYTTINITQSNDSSIFPAENQLTVIAPATNSKTTFIGYALVTIGENDSRTCDGLYAAGDTVLTETLNEYNNPDISSTKRIYAVWAQVETLTGGQVRLDDQSGMRVMGIVNTAILERVGLNIPDEDYERHMLFTTDDVLSTNFGSSTTNYSSFMKIYYLGTGNYSDISATSNTWYGNDHNRTETSNDNNTFSIIAQMDSPYYAVNWAYRAYLLFNYEDGGTKRAYGTFNNSSNMRSIQYIAQSFADDLRAQGKEDEDYLGLGQEAYNLLMHYAGTNGAN